MAIWSVNFEVIHFQFHPGSRTCICMSASCQIVCVVSGRWGWVFLFTALQWQLEKQQPICNLFVFCCRWVREFLSDQHTGLDCLVNYLSYIQQVVRLVKNILWWFMFLLKLKLGSFRILILLLCWRVDRKTNKRFKPIDVAGYLISFNSAITWSGSELCAVFVNEDTLLTTNKKDCLITVRIHWCLHVVSENDPFC